MLKNNSSLTSTRVALALLPGLFIGAGFYGCSGDETVSSELTTSGQGAAGGSGGSGTTTSGEGNGGGIGLDAGTIEDSGLDEDAACAQHSAAATLVKKPVDIIFVIDNSGSMGQEILGVQNNININFADIIGQSGIDYRVIMLAEHGPYNPLESICVEAPLSGIPQGGCASPPPEPINNPPRFFHYSYPVYSHDSLCKILDRFDKPDQFNQAPAGYTQWLRPEAFKIFVEITDDGVNCSHNGQSFSDSNSVNGGVTAGNLFDTALLALSPTHFGTATEGNYRWYSLIAVGNKVPNDPTQPWLPTDPITTTECPTAADPGTGYQQLSILTEGLRFPLCTPDQYDVVFNEIAQGVVEGAAIGCEFPVPDPPPGETLDLNTVVVEYTPGGGGTPEQFEQVANLSLCGPDKFYIEGDLIILCPEACDEVQADDAAQLLTLFGCDPGSAN